MKSSKYLVLNSWLQKADQNYISGRCLWLHDLLDGTCNLLWLSIEQMSKILVLQKISCSSSEEKDLDMLYKELDKKAKNIGHNVKIIIKTITAEYPQINIIEFEDLLQKVQEYFFRRYVVRKGSSINLKQIDRIDELYFILRDRVDPEIGIGTIDEIFIQKKRKSGHPIATFEYSYLNNKFFRARKHKEVSFFTADGSMFKENGT